MARIDTSGQKLLGAGLVQLKEDSQGAAGGLPAIAELSVPGGVQAAAAFRLPGTRVGPE